MAAAALAVAVVALATGAAAIAFGVLARRRLRAMDPQPFVSVSGRLTAGTQATVTVKPVTPRQAQQARQEEPANVQPDHHQVP